MKGDALGGGIGSIRDGSSEGERYLVLLREQNIKIRAKGRKENLILSITLLLWTDNKK